MHVVPTYLPATRYGGPIYSVHGLCRALVGRGHEVHVFTTNVDGPGDSAVPLGQPVDVDDVKVWYFPSRHLRRLYWSPPMWRALAREVPRFDLVHLHSVFLWPTWAAARAARRAGVSYVLSPRGMLVRDLIRRKNRWLKTAWIALIERRNVEAAALLHLTSEIEAAELRRLDFSLPPCRVIPNGVDAPVDGVRTAPATEDVRLAIDGGPYVLYLGRLSWKKRLDRLVAALALSDRFRLVIAGNDDENMVPQLRDWIEAANLRERAVIIPTFVSGADKAALLQRALVFVLPSFSENFGIAVLEAMAVGCPVVVSAGVGLADAIEEADAGIVVEGDDFSPALERILGDDALRERMGRNASRLVGDRYSWGRIAADMEGAYGSLPKPLCCAARSVERSR